MQPFWRLLIDNLSDPTLILLMCAAAVRPPPAALSNPKAVLLKRRRRMQHETVLKLCLSQLDWALSPVLEPGAKL